MAKYESPRYPALGFYVDGVFKRFGGGHYATDDAAEIAVLDALVDVRRVDVTEQEPEEPEKDVEPIKPASKSRAKSSAK